MQKIRFIGFGYWRSALLVISSVAALGFLYTFRLGALTHQLLSNRESDAQVVHQSLRKLVRQPLNAPYWLVHDAFVHLQPKSATFARLATVLFALTVIGLFYATMVRWHGRRAALLTTALFATSGWLLHVGRLDTGDIMSVLLPLSLLSLAAWAHGTKRHGLVLFYATLVSGLIFFTPGAIWFLLAGYVLIRRSILRHVREARVWEKSCSALIVTGPIVLLGHAIWQSPTILRSWLFIPSPLPAPQTIVRQLIESLSFLFVRGPYLPGLWLAHTPLFDVFSGAMCILGAYFYVRHFRNLRTHLLAVFLLLGCALTALHGAIGLSYMVPIVYLLAGTGLTYFLHLWLSVFPRNPLARGFGIGLVTLTVAAACVYHITNYFVAWRYNPQTVQAFRTQP